MSRCSYKACCCEWYHAIMNDKIMKLQWHDLLQHTQEPGTLGCLALWHVAAMVFSKVCEVHGAAVFCICLFCLSNGHAYVSRFKFAVNFSHEPHFNQAKLAGLAAAGCGQEHNPWVDKPPVTLVFDGCPFHQVNIESIRNDYLISVTIIVAALVCWHDPYSRPRLHPWHSVGLYLELKYLLDLCFI